MSAMRTFHYVVRHVHLPRLLKAMLHRNLRGIKEKGSASRAACTAAQRLLSSIHASYLRACIGGHIGGTQVAVGATPTIDAWWLLCHPSPRVKIASSLQSSRAPRRHVNAVRQSRTICSRLTQV